MWSNDDLDLVECALQKALDRNRDCDDHVDDYLLQKLMDEVHACRSKSTSSSSSSSSEKNSESLNAAVKASLAAANAALAAANAAQAAADSAAQNSQMIQLLLDTVNQKKELAEDDGSSLQQQLPDKRESKLVKMTKELRKQNILTHCILGFMVVATAIWRFKEVSLLLKLRKLLNNPLEAAVGGIFGGGGHEEQHRHQHHHHHKSRKDDVEAKTLQIPHLELPPIFQKTENSSSKTDNASEI